MTPISGLSTLGALVAQTADPGDLSAADWPAIVPLALAHGLGPMLLWTARQAGVDPHTHPELESLIQAAHHTAMAYILLEKTQRDVDATLRSASIPALWLKGAALARTVYPEPTLRPMSDLDVLVPYDMQHAAVAALESAGYRSMDTLAVLDRDKDALLAEKMIRYNYKFAIGKSTPFFLELHFRLLSTDDVVLPVEQLMRFWDQTELRDDILMLKPEANLLYLCAHAILQHGMDDFRLLRIFDIHQVIGNSSLNWDRVVEQAIELKWTYGVAQALELATRFFSTPVPEHVLTELNTRRPLDDFTPRPRFKGRGSRWENTRVQLKRLAMTEQALVVWKIIVPSRDYMRVRYDIPRSRSTWPYYFYRWWDQGRDVAWATWKRLTRRYG